MEEQVFILTETVIEEYRVYLMEQERSDSTVQKYMHTLHGLREELNGRPVTKAALIEWKRRQVQSHAPASVNAMLAAVNGLLRRLGRGELCLRFLKIQRQIFCSEERLLSREEYLRLVAAARARGDERMAMALQTICATGLRVSELRHITVEALRRGRAVIRCKNKTRVILIPEKLQRKLKAYCRSCRITSGAVFCTRTGRPMDRFYLWRRMKALCAAAGVEPGKVFPHNLRHLFARSFYAQERDVVRLADLLGHSSVNTTRIYTLDTGVDHRRLMERLAGVLLTT